jgi:hypothetical protein
MDLTKDFYVNLQNGRFDSTTATEMDGIFAKWNTDPTRPLIVHFHGGLVNEKSGMKTAQRLLQFYWDSGGYSRLLCLGSRHRRGPHAQFERNLRRAVVQAAASASQQVRHRETQ